MWRRIGLGVGLVILFGLAALAVWSTLERPRGPSGGTPAPAPAPTPVPSGELAALVDQAMAQLTRGQVLLSAPDSLDLGDKASVEARISRDLEQQLAEGLKGSGIKVLEVIDVSPLVSAELIGDDFVIEPPGPIDQLVGSEGFSQWSWFVSSRSAGDHQLGLRVSLRIKLEGQSEERKQATFIARSIHVRPNLARLVQEFVTEHTEWLATGIVIPLLGLAWHTWRQRAQPTPPARARRRSTTARRRPRANA
jgi:hypothetical protein